MRFDLVDLRLFLLIAETGSITLGAEWAGLALASASARIKGMEESLGVALLERQRRGVIPTAAGRSLIHHARAVQNQIERMTGELGQYADGLRARVRLLANTAAAELLSEMLASFLSRHGNIDIDLDQRPSHAIVEAVAGGAADLGIAAAFANPGDLEQREFGIDRLAVIASRKQRVFGRSRSLMFKEVSAQPFIGLAQGNPLQEHIVRHAARLGYHIGFRVRLSSFEAVCELVSRGIGISIVPLAVARRYEKTKELRSMGLEDDWATRRLVLCARSFDALSPQARLLADALSSPS
ncbi:MAG TPA: LysR substrate-binding domain-containing protein [Afipia sp.]